MTTANLSLNLNLRITSEPQSETPPKIEASITSVAQKAIQATGWKQTKYIGDANITSSTIFNDALLILTRGDGKIIWRELSNMQPNGTTLQTNYMFGQPMIIGGNVFYDGSDSESNWSVAKLDPIGRQITATSSNDLVVFGIATDSTHLWGISDHNIYEFNTDDLSLLNTYPIKVNTPDIIMYANNCLVVGDAQGGITIFNSTTMDRTGYFYTGFPEASLSLINPTTIAVSSGYLKEGAVTLLDPADISTTISSLGTIPYNGANSIVAIGADYITATPKGIGLYQIDSEGQWNFQQMLLSDPNGKFLDVDTLLVVSSTRFIATGFTGIYVFKYDPTNPCRFVNTGASSDLMAPNAYRQKLREHRQAQIIKV